MSLREHLPESVKKTLRPLVRTLRGRASMAASEPYIGHLDGLNEGGVLRGWVLNNASRKGYVPVGLYIGERLVETNSAQLLREDVASAMNSDAYCGFEFGLGLHNDLQNGAKIAIKTMTDPQVLIGEETLTLDDNEPIVSSDLMTRLAFVLKDDLKELAGLLDDIEDRPAPPKQFVPPPFEQHEKMFQTERVIPEIPLSGHPAYLDYVRYRYRMDESYQVEPDLESSDRFIYWYLTAYRSQEGRRVPLSAELISYLNAPIVMGSTNHSISRIMWWRICGRPDLMAALNLNDRDSLQKTLYWWADLDCPHLFFEDCLVPNRYADMLRGIHPSRRLGAYPLSYFTEQFFLHSPELHFLDQGSAEGRKLLTLALLVKAAKRPDRLRFMPHANLGKMFAEDDDGLCELERLVNVMLEKAPTDAELPEKMALSKARFAHALRKKDFDLASYQFLTISPNGDRFEAAAIERPDEGEVVDVQLIGPLAKASGLGQATRLSASILRETGLSVRGVDFDLDNPAPEGFSSDTMIEDYGPAKINIIHLNAESIPLAYAYQPDVFSGRYNIGYFFWELDIPAYCHYLGMDLLDEIWVSTEYGVEIYSKDDHGKPVVNVGMCYEETPGITREDARAYVNSRFLFNADHYVCLVAFDSFSFVQRKNPVSVLQAFQKAFEGVPNARLIVKTQNRDSVFDPVQVQLWDRVDAIISSDPRIIVLNETLSYKDLLRLKAGSDCYISLHKSEGWGFGMIEAMNLGVPVVCSAYSGNMDFCTEETSWLVDFEEKELVKGDYIFVRPGSKWAEPSVESAAKQLRAAYDDPKLRLAKAKAAQENIRTNFSSKAIAERYGARLREILKEVK